MVHEADDAHQQIRDALRLAAYQHYWNGNVTNLATGNTLGGYSNWGVRGKALLHDTGALSATLSLGSAGFIFALDLSPALAAFVPGVAAAAPHPSGTQSPALDGVSAAPSNAPRAPRRRTRARANKPAAPRT